MKLKKNVPFGQAVLLFLGFFCASFVVNSAFVGVERMLFVRMALAGLLMVLMYIISEVSELIKTKKEARIIQTTEA